MFIIFFRVADLADADVWCVQLKLFLDPWEVLGVGPQVIYSVIPSMLSPPKELSSFSLSETKEM